MTSGSDLKKLRALKSEREKLEQKMKDAQGHFAAKIGLSLIKSLGEDDAAKLADTIASMTKSARRKWFDQLIENERGGESNNAANSSQAERQKPGEGPHENGAAH